MITRYEEFDIDGGIGLLGYLVRKKLFVDEKEFISHHQDLMQLGFFRLPENRILQVHEHKPIKRTIDKTTEVIFLLQGKLEFSIFSTKRQLMTTSFMNVGDILYLTGLGSHSFKSLENDTIFIEVKQGPYYGETFDKIYW